MKCELWTFFFIVVVYEGRSKSSRPDLFGMLPIVARLRTRHAQHDFWL